MSSSVGMMTFPIEGKIRVMLSHVPNHQPDSDLMEIWGFSGDFLRKFNAPNGSL